MPSPCRPCGQSRERRLASAAPRACFPGMARRSRAALGRRELRAALRHPVSAVCPHPSPGTGPRMATPSWPHPGAGGANPGLGRAPPVQSWAQLPPTDGPPWAGVTRPLGEAMPRPPFTAVAEPWGPPEAQARGLRGGLWAEGSGLPAQPGPRRAPCSSQGRHRLEPRPPPMQHSHC